jgi:Type II CAAX prenyl endopeptidase Rce1-like
MKPYRKTGRLSIFLGLVALGMIGVLSLALVLAPQLEQQLVHGGAGVPNRTAVILMSLAQPTLLLALGAAIGCVFAPRMGLRSLLERSRPLTRLKRTAAVAIACGLTLAIVFTAADAFVFRSHLDNATVSALTPRAIESVVSAVLYGGLTEEIITRWGLLSLFAWLGWRVFERNRERASARVFYTAIVLSAVLFALAHLPAAARVGPLTTPLLTRVLALNTAAGLVFGWLFWRHNLETAMLAHATTHVGLAAAALVLAS